MLTLLQASNEVAKTASEAAEQAAETNAVGDAFTTYGPWGLAIVALGVAVWLVKKHFAKKPQ